MALKELRKLSNAYQSSEQLFRANLADNWPQQQEHTTPRQLVP
jgi:hypothetical protein